jgi:hypothetical protein
MFAIDLRSLAAFRIGIASLLLCDLVRRAVDLEAFYTDQGILPRIARMEMLGFGDHLGFQHQWSLHMASGELWLPALLVAIAAGFAVAMLVGYRTRLAVFASWLLLVSIDHRNPLVLDGGDTILRGLLFWSLFLPLGARWSIDRAMRPPPNEENATAHIHSVASAAVLLQLAMMYWASALSKWHPVWIRDFSAVYYALSADTLVTPWGLVVREHPRLMQVLTMLTMVLEFGGPIVAFSPWQSHWCRGLATAAFVTFHLGLSLTMELGLFPWICIAGWLLFLPGGFWDGLAEWSVVRAAGEYGSRFQARLSEFVPARCRSALEARAETPKLHRSWWTQAVIGLLFIYMVVWNVREVLGAAWVDRVMPHRYNGLACALGMVQNWSLFAPFPKREDTWLVMKGTLQDGSEVNLWEPGGPFPWTKPALLSATFPSSRWQVYLSGIPSDRFAFHRQSFANWLKRRWDRGHSQGRPEKTVAKVEIISLLEETPPPGEPIPEPESVEVCVRYYER